MNLRLQVLERREVALWTKITDHKQPQFNTIEVLDIRLLELSTGWRLERGALLERYEGAKPLPFFFHS